MQKSSTDSPVMSPDSTTRLAGATKITPRSGSTSSIKTSDNATLTEGTPSPKSKKHRTPNPGDSATFVIKSNTIQISPKKSAFFNDVAPVKEEAGESISSG